MAIQDKLENRLLSNLYFCRKLRRRAGARALEYLMYTRLLCAVDSWYFINRSEFGKKSNVHLFEVDRHLQVSVESQYFFWHRSFLGSTLFVS